MSEMPDAREDVVTDPPPATPALGPGDDDPTSKPTGTAAAVTTALGPGDGPAASEMATPPSALGPGDDDPRSQARGTAGAVSKPLGPGDDDGTPVDRGMALNAVPPADPGDGPESEFDMASGPPPSPGSVDAGPRRVTLIPKKKAAEAPVTVIAESQTRPSRRSTRGQG